MNLHDLLFKDWGAETLKAPVTRHHYCDGKPMRVELEGFKPLIKPTHKEPVERNKMFEVLKQNPGATAAKIASLTGKSTDNASRTLYVLTSLGKVTSKLGPVPKTGGKAKFLYYAKEAV